MLENEVQMTSQFLVKLFLTLLTCFVAKSVESGKFRQWIVYWLRETQ